MAITPNINIDFQVINTGDPKILSVLDTSTWGIIENKPSIIEIIVPNSNKTITHVFEKGRNNIFNSSNLLRSSIGQYNDLPDGVYKITIKGSPDTNCKHRDYLKTDKLRLQFDKLYATLGFDNTNEVIEKKMFLQDIDTVIRGAELLVAAGELKRGMAWFKKACDYLSDYNECLDEECRRNKYGDYNSYYRNGYY